MTIKTLLFLLFLYICLVWVGAARYLNPGTEFRDFGLKWTGIGLIVVFVLIVGSHLLRWLRQWRALPKRQKAPPKAAPIVHEDDTRLAAVIAEANATLAKAPDYQGQRDPIHRLPWRLLIGPEGSGKTSIFINSGVEPKLLAGQATETGTNASTPLCNLWLAQNTIFLELGGRAFDGDLARWTQLLRVIRGTESVPLWRRLLGKGEQRVMLRGAVAFCDLREFTAASADPQRFERSCRHWHDRLSAIGEVFGRLPIYQVITKCDGIPFFREFFHQLPEPDSRQVLGCTLSRAWPVSAEPGEAFAEVESKRLTKAFRGLYQSLAERRITQLAHENNPALRPAIYEFPRELKRIRGSIIQFLIDAFRPDPLRPGPFLRGYYFTAVREVETAATAPATSPEDWHTVVPRSSSYSDATHMFKPDTSIPSIDRVRSKRTTRRWSFVSDLFQRVVLADVPVQTAAAVDPRFELYRRRVFAGVVACCGLLFLGFFISWIGNRNLLNDVQSASVLPDPAKPVTLAELRNLDALRLQVERLRNGAGWWLHMGLYTGNRVMDAARTAYFRRFHQLFLDDLNKEMTDQLKALPVASEADAPYDPVYRTLKTHLMISAGKCAVEPELVSGVLKGVRDQVDSQHGSDWQDLSNRQVEFYANELVHGDPAPILADSAALERGRAYLRNIGGVERVYNAILSNARKSLTQPRGLAELVPNYAQVLKGQGEPPSGFTLEGWDFVLKASRDQKSALLGDCVFEDATQLAGDAPAETRQADLAPDIQRLYVRDYIRSWQQYLNGYSVVSYNGAEDAARKLEILSSNRSPLLALFVLTANQTNFPTGGLQKSVEGILKKVEKAAGLATDTTKLTPDPVGTPAEIHQHFQPVHLVVPPDSEIWVTPGTTAYLDGLAGLRSAMQAIASSPDAQSRLAAGQAAIPIRERAFDAVRQIARGFKPNGLDQVVQRLLREPIERVAPFIPTDIGPLTAGPINGELAALCKAYGSTFDKYPFRRSSTQEAGIEELSGWFAPDVGHVWKFQMGALGTFTQSENAQWKSKDPTQKPQVAPEMLTFLNRAQAIKDALFPKNSTRPQITYSLRPRLDSSFKSSTVEFEVDGQLHQWTTIFQKQFTWPAATGTKPGAIARIRTDSVAYAFISYGGAWGIFRMIAAAEPRAPQASVVEWRYTRLGGDQPPDLIQPGPVRMEFPEFPNGVDIFQPQFFDGLRCPARAVAVR